MSDSNPSAKDYALDLLNFISKLVSVANCAIDSMSKGEADKISDMVNDTQDLLHSAQDAFKKLESHPDFPDMLDESIRRALRESVEKWTQVLGDLHSVSASFMETVGEFLENGKDFSSDTRRLLDEEL